MAIQAISSVNYSTSAAQSLQSQLFGTVLSGADVERLLKQYGIMETGDYYTDINALYRVMSQQAKTTANSEVSGGQSTSSAQQAKVLQGANSRYVPWANLMSQVGLTATGNMLKDLDLFNQTISMMQVAAQSPEAKANVAQLSSQASMVFVTPNQLISSLQGPSQNTQQASGADVLAMLNKMYLLG